MYNFFTSEAIFVKPKKYIGNLWEIIPKKKYVSVISGNYHRRVW